MRRKEVFVSAVSRDFASYRDVAKQALLDIGAHPIEQHNFPTDYRELDEVLAARLDPCDAMIHIVGPSYGTEPPPSPGRPRRSYTQWEYYRAFEGPQKKPTYVFLARPDCPFDTKEPEDAEKQHLQNQHTDYVKQTGRIYYEFSTKEELRERIHRSDPLRALIAPRLARIQLRPLGDRFIGRRSILEALEAEIVASSRAPSQPIVIRGGGGIGKTALAVEIGWRLYEAGLFRFVILLNASTPETVDSELADLCLERVLEIPERSDSQQSKRRDGALAWLADMENGPQTLLILDGVDATDARDAVRPLLQKIPHCVVLLTSRHTEWGDKRVRELELFTPTEALEYLRSRLGTALGSTEHEAALRQIASVVDHLPVGLELVASYLRDTHQSPAEWLIEWSATTASTLEHHDADAVGYPVSLARVWEQSVARLTPLALGFLGVFASLAPRPAFLPLQGVRRQHNWPEARAAFSELSKASLVAWPAGDDAVSIHRLLQAILLHKMSSEERKESLELALVILSVTQPTPEYDDANWRLWAQLEPHLSTVIHHLREFPLDLDTRDVLSTYAAWLVYNARYDEATSVYRTTVAIAEHQGGPDAPKLASELVGLSSVLSARGRMSEAEATVRRAIRIFESTPDPHPHLCYGLDILARILADTNRLTEAIAVSEKAISASEKTFGDAHPRTIACVHNLASWLIADHRLQEAEPLLHRVLKGMTKQFGPDHPNVAATLNELGELARMGKRLADAEAYFRGAVTIVEASPLKEGPEMATYLNNLGLTLGAVDQSDRAPEAEALFARSIEIDARVFGPEHPKIANRMSNLAWLLSRTGRLEEAEPLARKAVEILLTFKSRNARDHSSWESTLKQYVSILMERGGDAELVQAAYRDLVKQVNDEHIRMLTNLKRPKEQ